MKRTLLSFAAFAVLASVIAVEPLGAQAGPSGATVQGFNSQALVFELSLFLPEEVLGNAFGAAARGGFGRSAPAGQQMGAGGGSQSGPTAQAGAGQQGQRPTLQFARDPKLFLTIDQVDRLRPILAVLKDNPMPSPSKARQIQSDVDAILTSGQKAEFGEWRKAVDNFRKELRQRYASGGNQNGFPQGGGQGSGSDQAPGQANGAYSAGGPGQNSGVSQLQRRQRILEVFLSALDEYRKGLS